MNIIIFCREKAAQSPRFELYSQDCLKDEHLRTALRIQQACLLSRESSLKQPFLRAEEAKSSKWRGYFDGA